MDGAVDIFRTSFRTILPTNKELPITNIVHSLMDMRATSETATEFALYDPKSTKGGVAQTSSSSGQTVSRVSYQETVVVVIGGGNYIEYQNLQDYAQRQRCTIIYGCTDLVAPNEFLQQFTSLNEKK